MMSNSDKIEDSPNDNDFSEDVFQNQEEELDRIPTKTIVENLPPLGELASESESSRSLKVSRQLSNQPPTLSTQAPNLDQLEDSTHVDPLRELRSHASRSRSVEVVISSEQNPTTASLSVLHDSNTSGAKTIQKNMSPFAACRNADFTSPPERGTAPVTRPLSKNLKETNTPSPEKRCVETDVGSTPIKRLKKTPDSDSVKPKTEIELCGSEFSVSAHSKASYKSPTNLQIQQIRKNEESELMSTPSSIKKRKTSRNSSGKSKTESDPCLSNVMSPSSAANTVDESPTNSSKAAILNVDESLSERKASLSSRVCSTDSNSSSKHSSPDYTLITASFLNLLTEGHETAVSNKSTDASSANPNLKTKKHKDVQSISDASDEETPLNLTPERSDIIIHLRSSANTSLLRPNDVSGKQRDRLPDLEKSSKAVQPNLPIKEVEPVVHPLRLTDQTSSSNLEPSSESQNYITEVSEPRNEVKKVQDSASVSDKETESVLKMTQSAIETQIFKYFQSFPLFLLNPHLPSSCHLPRRSNIHATDARRRVLDFVKSDQVRIDQNRLNSSTQTSPPDTESGLQTKKSPVSRSLGSLLDNTPTSRNSPELSQCKMQGKFPNRKHRRSVSDGTLKSSKSTEDQGQQDPSNSLVMSQSKDTPLSKSLPEISEGVNRIPCLIQTLSGGKPPISASKLPSVKSDPLEFSHSGRSLTFIESSTLRNNPETQTQRSGNDLLTSATSNPLEFSHFSRSIVLLQRMTEALSSNESSTSRNNPKLLTHGDGNGSPPQRKTLRLLSGKTSTSRNQPEVLRDIDVSEGQASTSKYQPIITGSSPNDQSCLLSSRNGAGMAGGENNSSQKALEGETSAVDQEPSSTDGSSSNDLLDFSDDPTSPEVSHSEDNTDHSHTPPHTNHHPEYIVGARQLLLSVLKELMLYGGEDTQWTLFEASFSHISDSRPDRISLIEDLLQYNKRKEDDVWTKVLLLDYVMTELHILVFCGRFTLIVVKTLVYTLSVSCSRCWYYRSTLNPYHEQFKSLCSIFSRSWETVNVEDIQDESCRNRMQTWKEMIQRLLLVALMAFRLLLINVGENIPKIIIEPFESGLLGEDKMYLRRHK